MRWQRIANVFNEVLGISRNYDEFEKVAVNFKKLGKVYLVEG